MAWLSKIFGDANEKYLNKARALVEQINRLEKEFEGFSFEQLKAQTKEFKVKLKAGKTLNDILVEAFALVRETSKRTLGQRHYDVQLLGGFVLHQGSIAEMKTGEGKTLASTLAVYLNALLSKGVHVVTVNDYLAKRDTVWMGQIYHTIGLTVGCIVHDTAFLYDPEYQQENPKSKIQNPKQIQNPKSKIHSKEREKERDKERDLLGGFKVVESYLKPCSRKEAYLADITYGTNNEFGFDYLRDNMAQSIGAKVQRGFHYAIVDEIDSILIDEARTPLIISQPDFESSKYYKDFAKIIPRLKQEDDFTVDEKSKTAVLTEEGIDKIEGLLGLKDIYTEKGIKYLHHLEQALRAEVFFKKDREYIVKAGQVIIIDEFTGRLMPGRRYSAGLHQAIEAKEGLEVQAESKTLASITFQNYFRFYQKLAGMTGTAQTSAEEFDKVYGLSVIVIPTNKPCLRRDLADKVYQTEQGKFRAIVKEIRRLNEKGQPVLVGTRSVERNEYLSRLLDREGVAHQVLNAKNHQREGEIIAQAGRLGAVTIATNMAGRGVDIMLGGPPPSKLKANEEDLCKQWEEEHNKVVELGGLHVLGTERHEARRIDDQLRGRAGRQGDAGSSQFFLSLEDDILRVFGGERLKGLMAMLKIEEDQPIEAKILSSAIEKAQQKVESMHFDLRRHVLEYDDVISKQRNKIYTHRDEILNKDYSELKKFVLNLIEQEISQILASGYFDITARSYSAFGLAQGHSESKARRTPVSENSQDQNLILAELRTILPVPHGIPLEEEALSNLARRVFQEKEEKEGRENMAKLLRFAVLQTIDFFWSEHLDSLDHLRDSVTLRAYGGKDPLVEYKTEGRRLFQSLESQINFQIARTIFKLSLQQQA